MNEAQKVTSANYMMTGTLNGLSAEEVERQRIYLLGENNCWYQERQQALLPYRAYLQGSTPITLSNAAPS